MENTDQQEELAQPPLLAIYGMLIVIAYRCLMEPQLEPTEQRDTAPVLRVIIRLPSRFHTTGPVQNFNVPVRVLPATEPQFQTNTTMSFSTASGLRPFVRGWRVNEPLPSQSFVCHADATVSPATASVLRTAVRSLYATAPLLSYNSVSRANRSVSGATVSVFRNTRRAPISLSDTSVSRANAIVSRDSGPVLLATVRVSRTIVRLPDASTPLLGAAEPVPQTTEPYSYSTEPDTPPATSNPAEQSTVAELELSKK